MERDRYARDASLTRNDETRRDDERRRESLPLASQYDERDDRGRSGATRVPEMARERHARSPIRGGAERDMRRYDDDVMRDGARLRDRSYDGDERARSRDDSGYARGGGGEFRVDERRRMRSQSPPLNRGAGGDPSFTQLRYRASDDVMTHSGGSGGGESLQRRMTPVTSLRHDVIDRDEAPERRTVVVKEMPSGDNKTGSPSVTSADAKHAVAAPPSSSATAPPPARLSDDERARLKRDIEERGTRLQALEKELELLQRQQATLMRRKQREHDGHKDPLLLENTRLQDEISRNLVALRKFAEISANRLREDSLARNETKESGDRKRKHDIKQVSTLRMRRWSVLSLRFSCCDFCFLFCKPLKL